MSGLFLLFSKTSCCCHCHAQNPVDKAKAHKPVCVTPLSHCFVAPLTMLPCERCCCHLLTALLPCKPCCPADSALRQVQSDHEAAEKKLSELKAEKERVSRQVGQDSAAPTAAYTAVTGAAQGVPFAVAGVLCRICRQGGRATSSAGPADNVPRSCFVV